MVAQLSSNNSVDHYAYFDQISPRDISVEWELGTDKYSPKVQLSEFALRAYHPSFGEDTSIVLAPKKRSIEPSYADVVTMASFGLGVWWAVGGPVWAALLSIIFDEVDGRIARASNTTSERGAAFDWGSDISLTTMALMRLGNTPGFGMYTLAISPIVLYGQAHLKGEGYRPPFGSARAVIMLVAIAAGYRAK